MPNREPTEPTERMELRPLPCSTTSAPLRVRVTSSASHPANLLRGSPSVGFVVARDTCDCTRCVLSKNYLCLPGTSRVYSRRCFRCRSPSRQRTIKRTHLHTIFNAGGIVYCRSQNVLTLSEERYSLQWRTEVFSQFNKINNLKDI